MREVGLIAWRSRRIFIDGLLSRRAKLILVHVNKHLRRLRANSVPADDHSR